MYWTVTVWLVHVPALYGELSALVAAAEIVGAVESYSNNTGPAAGSGDDACVAVTE